MRYDVLELRRAAAQVKNAANAVGDRDKIRNTKNLLAGSFRGEAADALDYELTGLQSDLLQLAGGLSAIYNELIAYARRLEQADKDAMANILKK